MGNNNVKKGPAIYDLQSLIQAGIDPKTKLPIKMASTDPAELVKGIKANLRVIDEQNAVESFRWINLPSGLDGELIERILYYRGQGMFFFMPTDEKFYFLPYALDGTIDCYGRYTGVTPLPFNGTAAGKDDKPWITGLNRKPIYGIKSLEDLTIDDFEGGCVLLHDYAKQISQTTISRQTLNEPVLQIEAEMLPLMRTACILGTGVKGMRVQDEDQQAQVKLAGQNLYEAAIKGEGYVPIVGNVDFQELTDGANLKGADYMQAMESIDNFRLGLHGLDNGGLFQKKAHMLETEQAQQGGAVGLVFQNRLSERQKFCDIVNSIWDIGMWCEPSEAVLGGDVNGDGFGYDREQPGTEEGEGGSDNDTNDANEEV